ncbi:MAG: hypothetical protein ACI4TK_13410 [Agathobacter sp.]
MIGLKGVDDLRFIYVMNLKDKDKLEKLGYNLLKVDKANSIFIFENKTELNFELDTDMQYILSDTLTF